MNLMPGIQAVTTCSRSGFNTYGRRMMQSWVKNWPVRLTCYVEGGYKLPAGVEGRDIGGINWLREFLAGPDIKGPTCGTPSAYRHDAKRFSFKTATVINAAITGAAAGRRYLIWVDADCFWHEPVPPKFVESLLPSGDEFLSWLWRDRSYPETGFVVYDLAHHALAEVMDSWRRLYAEGEIYNLPEWHDAWVLQWLMQQRPHLTTKSISGNGASHGHPFINGPLGQYGDHMKGGRKTAGRSGRSECVAKHSAAYWRR